MRGYCEASLTERCGGCCYMMLEPTGASWLTVSKLSSTCLIAPVNLHSLSVMQAESWFAAYVVLDPAAGRAVVLPSAGDPLSSQQYIAVAELQAGRGGSNDRITLGAGLPAAAIDRCAQQSLPLLLRRLALAQAPAAVLCKRL